MTPVSTAPPVLNEFAAPAVCQLGDKFAGSIQNLRAHDLVIRAVDCRAITPSQVPRVIRKQATELQLDEDRVLVLDGDPDRGDEWPTYSADLEPRIDTLPNHPPGLIIKPGG